MLTNLLFAVYRLAERSKLLQLPAFRRLFEMAYFAYKRYWEDSFAALIRVHPELFRGGDVLDAGANIGYTAYVFAGAVDAGCKVHAFEPELQNYRDLQRVAGRSNGVIIPIQAAVGAENGTVSLCLNRDHPADHRVLTKHFEDDAAEMGRMEVPLLALTDYVESLCPVPRVSFVKIDVQGFELEVCRGVEGLLARNPDLTIAIEYMPEALRSLGYDPEDLLKWLRSKGFRLHLLAGDGTLSEVTDEVRLGPRGYEDLICRLTPIPSLTS